MSENFFARLHPKLTLFSFLGDSNGDGRDDLLRTCDNPNYNAILYGAPTGASYPFISGGYVIQCCVLHNDALPVGVKVHVGDLYVNFRVR